MMPFMMLLTSSDTDTDPNGIVTPTPVVAYDANASGNCVT